MKKLICLTLALALFVLVPIAEARYTLSEYRDEVSYRGSLDPQLDPIYQIIASLGADEIGTGEIWYVDSGATGAATGKDLVNACLTIEAAINIAETDGAANRGDRIYVVQGHTTTKSVTGALFTADIAGMSIKGLGEGDNRPVLILSHTGAKIDITADNVRFSNFYIDATGVDSVNTPINLNGEGCILDNLFVRLADSHGQADLGITIGVADGDANDVIIANCIFESPDAGCASAIGFAKDMSNVILSNLLIYGDFSTAGVDVPNGAEAQVNLLILDSTIINTGTDDHAIEIYGTGNTGAIVNCTLVSDAAATILDAGGLQVSHDTDLLMIGNSQPTAMPANKGIYDLLGAYTADSGADDEDTLMAHLDLIYVDSQATVADTEAMDTSAELVALVDPNYVSYDAPRLISDTTGAMTIANGYDQNDDPVIFTVTGDIMARACAYATTQVTSTSSDTLTLGVAGDTACLLLSDVVDGTAFDVNFVWTLTQAPDTTSAELDAEWVVIPGGLDIQLYIDDHGLTAGVMVFYLQWIPLSADAAVVGAAP